MSTPLTTTPATRTLQRPFTITGMDVSGFMVKDAERAIAFYCELFGSQPSMLYPDNRGAEFVLPDGSTFALWGGNGGAGIAFQPSNGILFAVDDFDAAVAALKARSIPIVMERDTPYCRMAVIEDTEGNSVFLHKRKTV